MANPKEFYSIYVLAYAQREARPYGEFDKTLASALGCIHGRREGEEMLMPSSLAARLREMGAEEPDDGEAARRELRHAKEALEQARERAEELRAANERLGARGLELQDLDRETRAALDADPNETTPAAARRVMSAVPDCGPTDRDLRGRDAAQERLKRLILADGQTDTGGRWLYDAAADEIVRLRAELDLRVTPASRLALAEAREQGAAEMRERAAALVLSERDAAVSEWGQRVIRRIADAICALPLSRGDVVTVEQQREIEAVAKARASEEAADQGARPAAGLSGEDAETLRVAGWHEEGELWRGPAGGLVDPRTSFGLRGMREAAAALRRKHRAVEALRRAGWSMTAQALESGQATPSKALAGMRRWMSRALAPDAADHAALAALAALGDGPKGGAS